MLRGGMSHANNSQSATLKSELCLESLCSFPCKKNWFCFSEESVPITYVNFLFNKVHTCEDACNGGTTPQPQRGCMSIKYNLE
jgi:hypothetical protein